MQRRGFLRSIIAGSGMILVPKLADHFQWKGRLAVPDDLIVIADSFGGGYWRVGDRIAVVQSGVLVAPRVGTVTRITRQAGVPVSLTIQWPHAPQ